MLWFGSQKKPRRFSYSPRFYRVPEEDERQDEIARREHRLRFHGYFLEHKRAERRSVVGLILLLVIVIYMFFYLRGLERQDRRASTPIKVEDIQVIDVSPQK